MKYTDLIKNSKFVTLDRIETYSKQDSVNTNTLVYSIDHEGKSFTFPVPIIDLGDSTVKPLEKSIYFARWIRKAMENGTFIER